ncbi:MAG: M48 family metallopeptidase [Bacteroidetes bacterium]|jgi:predicted Zn-dependent protease|nr:M48 family metallopeptidase [Bacteroidota bacterium]MDF1863250.1 M48 family metallopeptidase [Saprospiraceae bacterium]
MLIKKMFFAGAIFVMLPSLSCSLQSGQGLNFFSIEDDKALGKQFSEEIEKNPKDYPLLSEKGNEEAYRYIRGLTNQILNSGEVAYRNEFDWTVKIIKDDKTLNAFAVPGGYLYVYTGLIKYLDTEDQLAGVMGHEIAHAALRHSTKQMTKIYGLDALRYLITGKEDAGAVSQLLLSLTSLKFSRSHESQADEFSVRYLCGTNHYAGGAAGFFEKIQGSGETPPEFLSTHPDPGNRVDAIKSKATELGCTGSQKSKTNLDRIKRILP